MEIDFLCKLDYLCKAESAGNGTGFSYSLVAKQAEPSTATDDVRDALDELNELGVLDTFGFFEDDEAS
jgi:hypothetical protein